ncbi:MAG TPA: rRNA maturation RNase YbeY [Bacteroidia bacterium]|nr:rRNA maturation RNase YbeY [Bacteroidia bacterium]
MSSIVFQSEEELDFSVSKESHIKDWIKKIIRKEGKTCGQLYYFFCGDEHLLNINKEFLNHDTYTDIITFDYSEKKAISGEIFISIDRVRENAGKYKVTFEKELLRTVIHGVLHLCGYGDKKPTDRKKMRAKEDEALVLYSQKGKISAKRS